MRPTVSEASDEVKDDKIKGLFQQFIQFIPLEPKKSITFASLLRKQ